MINLLPQTYKKAVKKEVARRFVVVLGILLLFFFAWQFFFLLNFKFLTRFYSHNFESALEDVKKTAAINNLVDMEIKVDEANNLLTLLSQTQKSNQHVSENLNAIINNLPPEIKLSSFRYGADKPSVFKIYLTGSAQNRNALIKFVDRLKALPSFAEIESPVSNLLKEEGASFTISITLKN